MNETNVWNRIFVPAPADPGGANLVRRFAAEKAAWIWRAGPAPDQPEMAVFRIAFDLDAPTPAVIHLSADHRYAFRHNGRLVSRGPHRSDQAHWSFSSYEVVFAPGRHALEATVHWMGSAAPESIMGWRGGFLLAAEGSLADTLDTGKGAWTASLRPDQNYFTVPVDAHRCTQFMAYIGEPLLRDGRPNETDPQPAAIVRGAIPEQAAGAPAEGWKLWPTPLPDLLDYPLPPPRVRAVVDGALDYLTPLPASAERDPRIAGWQAMLDGRGIVRVPAGQTLTAILDTNDYHAVYNGCVLDGTPGAVLKIGWTECFRDPFSWWKMAKANRDEIVGKLHNAETWDQFTYGLGKGNHDPLDGAGDGGGSHARRYEAATWRAGRYIVLTLSAPEEGPARLVRLDCRGTRYPLEYEGHFRTDYEMADRLVPLLVRTHQLCSFETYIDCPHFEQLSYLGDTRVEQLNQYVICRDARLQKRSTELYAWSRREGSFCAGRYPSRQHGPAFGFGILWTPMLRDFSLWRDDPEWVKALLPEARASVDAGMSLLSPLGLLKPETSGNFVDHIGKVPGFDPANTGECGTSVHNLLLLMALDALAGLEEDFGIEAEAARRRAEADALRAIIIDKFWTQERGLVADDSGHRFFTEHASALAVITGAHPPAERARLAERLFWDGGKVASTIYFKHYTLEALGLAGRGEMILDILGYWRLVMSQGLKTIPEHDEKTDGRSDCHAWSAHPLYHYVANIAGIRPAAAGFRKVRIAPSPFPLRQIEVKLPHPQGFIEAEMSFGPVDQHPCGITMPPQKPGRDAFKIILPDGVTGELAWKGQTHALRGGENRIG